MFSNFCNTADQHQVIKVKMSKPIVHDVTSCEPINWKVNFNGCNRPLVSSYAITTLTYPQMLLLNLTKLSDEDTRKVMEKFSRTIRSLQS